MRHEGEGDARWAEPSLEIKRWRNNMPKYMCIRTTVTDRLYEAGKIYELPAAPNKHFQVLESPKAEMEKSKGRPLRGEPPRGEKKDEKTPNLME
jgi:hypothetical protein